VQGLKVDPEHVAAAVAGHVDPECLHGPGEPLEGRCSLVLEFLHGVLDKLLGFGEQPENNDHDDEDDDYEQEGDLLYQECEHQSVHLHASRHLCVSPVDEREPVFGLLAPLVLALVDLDFLWRVKEEEFQPVDEPAVL